MHKRRYIKNITWGHYLPDGLAFVQLGTQKPQGPTGPPLCPWMMTSKARYRVLNKFLTPLRSTVAHLKQVIFWRKTWFVDCSREKATWKWTLVKRTSSAHGGFKKIGLPQNGWFRMESPIKMDDLGGPLFLEPPTSSEPNLHLLGGEASRERFVGKHGGSEDEAIFPFPKFQGLFFYCGFCRGRWWQNTSFDKLYKYNI